MPSSSAPAVTRHTPQLVMRINELATPPALHIPDGYLARSYVTGDAVFWEQVIDASFKNDAIGKFDQLMQHIIASL